VKISFYKSSDTEASITLKIEEADYQARVVSRIKEYSKKASIKGFRPGSVPTNLIQKMYGHSILTGEVNALLVESLEKYLVENEIHALGEPIPVPEKNEAIDWNHQRDFEFEYIIGMAGTFSCHLSKHIQVTAYKISHVAEQTVDDLVEQMRKTYGPIEAVDKSASGDVIHGELRYPVQNLKVHTQIVVAEIAAKVRSIFMGLSPNEEVTFDVKQVMQGATALPGLTEAMYDIMLRLGGVAKFTVEKIYRRSLAALEQEFFDKVLGSEVANSEQEFRQKLQLRLLQHKQREADALMDRSIQATLLQAIAIALPDHLLQSWLQKNNDTVSKEQIALYYQQYAKELRWSLLAAALSKKYTLQVTHEEVVDEVQCRLQDTFASTGGVQRLPENDIAQLAKNFLQEENGKHYKRVRADVHVRKLMGCIKDQIMIVTQEVSTEALDALALE
jgi:trigger factor